MQFRLFSFALIILNCMDYGHCQASRWRRSKREFFLVVSIKGATACPGISLNIMECMKTSGFAHVFEM
ncbi:hypothetical protein Q9233_014458 [Columba guinea]|nr:hypothetical protein Q9233_014458 [Columba guinea]